MAHTINNAIYLQRAIDANGTPIVSQTKTVSTLVVQATGYTAFPEVDGVAYVTFDITGGNIRCYWEGSTPTSTSGHMLYAGGNYTWSCAKYNAAKFIRDSGSSTDAIITASPESN